MSLYPDIRLRLILTDEELDLGMREADLALRLREPQQPDLIRRRLFTVHYHAYASTEYLKRNGQPKSPEDLDNHRLIGYEGGPANYLTMLLNTLQSAGRDAQSAAHPGPDGQQHDRHAARRAERRRPRRFCPTTWSSRTAASCSCCRRPTCRNSTAISSIRKS